MPRIFAENRRGAFDYDLLEKFRAGLVLTGQEVKSIKLGRASLAGSYVLPQQAELWLVGCHIPPYQPKNAPGNLAERNRKLLLQKRELRYLAGKASQKGLTFLPLKLYTDRSQIKLEFALAKPLKKWDKREIIKKREAAREMRESLGTP